MGEAEELTWGRWLVVMDGNVSRYGGQPIVLRLLVFFLALLAHPVHWLWYRARLGVCPGCQM